MNRPLWVVGADGSVVSRALGVLRLSLLALAIGQGLVANAFATASLLPYLISLVVTGGILSSTLLTLLVLPALYRLAHRRAAGPFPEDSAGAG